MTTERQSMGGEKTNAEERMVLRLISGKWYKLEKEKASNECKGCSFHSHQTCNHPGNECRKTGCLKGGIWKRLKATDSEKMPCEMSDADFLVWMAGYAEDHEPEGWLAVQMWGITRLVQIATQRTGEGR